MMAFLWRRLPDVAHRRFQGRVVPGFGARLALFFATFCASFGAYVMSFVMGTQWGVGYGRSCVAACERAMSAVGGVVDRIGHPLVARFGEGLSRLLSNDMPAVMAVSFALGVTAVVLACAVSLVASCARALSGGDGSQAELIGDADGGDPAAGRADVTDGGRDKDDRDGRLPDLSDNPYSAGRLQGA